MAAPNLNATSMIATAAVDTQTPNSTSEQTLTTNAAASGHTFITLSLAAANNTGSGVAIRINWYDGTNNHRLLFDAVVPGNAQIECAPTRKELLEGWTVKVTTNTINALEFQHHYLDCH